MANLEPILELLQQPALLCAKERIVYCNPAARRILLMPEMELSLLLGDQLSELESLQGSLSLSVRWGQLEYQLTATELEGRTLLLLNPVERGLVSMVVLQQVAASLRASLSPAVLSSQSLFPYLEEQEDEVVQSGTATINRAFYGLIRGMSLASDCSALELGEMLLTPEMTHMCDFFEDLADDSMGFVEENGLTLRLQLPARPFNGDIDRQLVERAVFNLLCNAIAHTAPGGVITLRLEQMGDRAMVYVTDTGEGFDADLMGFVTSRSELPGPNADGLGLGLRFVRAVAERHGGSLLIRSGDTGATVCFSLGLTRGEEEQVLRSPAVRYDYSGGLDHAHVEFAGVMDDEDYDSRSI